jgi:hypothetical protein
MNREAKKMVAKREFFIGIIALILLVVLLNFETLFGILQPTPEPALPSNMPAPIVPLPNPF